MGDESNWRHYYRAIENRPPHDTLLRALALFDGGPDRERFAVDLGCGSGRDTREMLRRGWRVLAIDREPAGIQQLVDGVTADVSQRLTTQVAAFEALTGLPACDFVNASFSLPFCTPRHFPQLWQMICDAIEPRGRFAGTFFGVHDSWTDDPAMTFHTREQVEALFERYKLEMLIEEERDGHTALGARKHWHTFQVVAFWRA